MKGRITLAVMLLAATSGAATAQKLVVWHDKGEDGIKLVQDLSNEFAKTHPGVTVSSVSMPTDQWFSKSIAALNTASGPDILFNDNMRFVTVQQATNKLCDVKDVLDKLPAGDRNALSEGDLASGTVGGQLVMMPFQRVITAWGVRKSWLEKVGEKPPLTWEDTLRVARKFQEMDPDGNGRNDTFGMALQGGGSGSLIGGGIALFTVGGNRMPFTFVDDNGKITLKDPRVSVVLREYLKVYTDYKLVSPDTINHGFTDMYQLIEGGRAGMFRVGNWNVGKWDREALKGDYIVGPFPSFSPNTQGTALVSSTRGMGIACNGKNVPLAKEFAALLVTKTAQQASLDNMGGAVRADLDLSKVTPSLRGFVDGSIPQQVDSFQAARLSWYNELQEEYYKLLVARLNNPSQDFDAWLASASDALQAKADQLRK
jgi:ABC-type glycerol-3-phosphate transport system substrate-binding protein